LSGGKLPGFGSTLRRVTGLALIGVGIAITVAREAERPASMRGTRRDCARS
jgi:hypothetical protein